MPSLDSPHFLRFEFRLLLRFSFSKKYRVKKAHPLKPRQIEGLRTCVPSTGVFACIGDGEAKNGDFGGKIAKLEKARYGSNAKKNARKLTNTRVLRRADATRKRREKSYFSKNWRRSVYRNLTNSKLGVV